MDPPAHRSNPAQPPVTPSHTTLLPSLSPSISEQTPAPLHTLPVHLRQPMSQHMADDNVFGSVMGGPPGHATGPDGTVIGSAQSKVYASVYSGIPVFEAMIRGISVMRRTSDSWVNATQILKVAGVHKSARTKILEKEVLTGIHEKVQGGYGKYQGTWVPLDRGRELAEQYGVAAYLTPIFEFQPSASVVSALPAIRTETAEHAVQKNSFNISSGQYLVSPLDNQFSPFHNSQYGQGPSYEQMMNLPPHPSSMAYPSQPKPYYTLPSSHIDHQTHLYDDKQDNPIPPSMNGDSGVTLPANMDRMGLPYNPSDVYIDQYGQPHATNRASLVYRDSHVAKKQKSDVQGDYVAGDAGIQVQDEQTQEGVSDHDSTASDDARDTPPIPSSMLLPHKPVRPRPTSVTARNKNKLIQIFNIEGSVDLRSVFGLGADQAANFDVDMVIDDQGHSALHWACALAKMDIVTQLIELGADIHRGNYAGETPLVRSVLTSNHAETGSFPQLLQYLSPSIRTLDHAYRTVLHHIALIAGIKGRASSARAYLANVLEWVAREQQQVSLSITDPPDLSSSSELEPISLKMLVDVQDVHGDTALNVAARVGNKSLVNLLLDAGADKARANKLGLRPENFGLEIEALKVTNGDAVVADLVSESSKPERKSRDIQKNLATIFDDISTTFAQEMLAKQTKLNATEASVRHATKALADKRQQLHQCQEQLDLLLLYEQRSENVKRILDAAQAGSTLAVEEFTGRTQTSEEKTLNLLPPLAFREVSGPYANLQFPSQSNEDEDNPLPERNDVDVLIKLRRVALWEDRIAEILEDRIKEMEGEGLERTMKYRKLVSLCSKVPVDRVDGMLDNLVAAVESEDQTVDFSKINDFVHKIRDTQA
ncbi:uncharacterized protein L203_103882 [Cryptococcus depauperatus CBS 7841]|uniref:HTH APSES-type domain-containing protein n=1 Tax=Cryptococcus depauperatus CBS 7841 TaxID=1295531 RepID=A0AAJ8JUR8_9TREE